MSELPIVEINKQPIELCKLLKIANFVGGGGEAKMVISEGYVYLNGEQELQKRKKVYENDVIEFDGEAVKVVIVKGSLVKSTIQKLKLEPSQPSPSAKQSKNQQSQQTETAPVQTRSKRKPISF